MESCLGTRSRRPSGQAHKVSAKAFISKSCMDLGFLMSDPPVRGIKINLFLARINIFVSYSLVIFGVDQQHDGEKSRICDIGR